MSEYYFNPRDVRYINIPSKKIYDIASKDVYDLTYQLSDEEKDLISLTGEVKELDLKVSHTITQELMKEILIEVIEKIKSEDQNARLHFHPYFVNIHQELNDLLLKELRKVYRDKFFLDFNDLQELINDGLGFVVTKSEKERIATFESIEISMNEDTNELYVDFSYLFTPTALENYRERDIQLIYYSILHEKIFTFSIKDLKLIPEGFTTHGEIKVEDISIEPFDNKHVEYYFIQEQLPHKEEIRGISPLENINEGIYDSFRKKRLKIIENYFEQLRKEEIFQEFADIEF